MLDPEPPDQPRATAGTYASIAGLALIGLALLAFGALLIYGSFTLTQELATAAHPRRVATPGIIPLGGLVSAGVGVILLYFVFKFTRNIIRTGNWEDPDD